MPRPTPHPVLPALSVRQYNASPGSHAHPHFQILLGLDGELALEVEGRGRRVGPGEGLVIAPGDRHDFEAALGARCLVLDSTDRAWERLQAQPPASDVLPLARHIAQASQTGRPRALQLGPALLLEAWAPVADAPARSRRPIDWAALQRWALANAAAALGVADLAARVHLSAAQFSDRCRQECGMSPMAWLRELRLAQARALRASGLPVACVAHRCGYRSPSALTAALRRASAPGTVARDD